MKMPVVKGLVPALVALIVFSFISTAIASDVLTALAIEIGSFATRLSIIGDNGLPRLIFLGPGTQSRHGPSESMWTTEGFLLIKDGTDEASYVHPSNTFFNLEQPVAFSAQNLSENRPNITGYQTFTLIDITAKYLKGLQTSAVTIIGRDVNFVSIVTPGGNGLRTSEETILGQNTTFLSTVVTDDNGLEESRQAAISDAAAAAGLRYFTRRKSTCAAFEFENGMEYERAILVYRLGSSTLQVSVIEGGEGAFYTLSSVYDQHLGGNDFNKRVVNHLLLAHKKKTCQDLSSDDNFMSQLGREVEKAKQALSSQNSVRIEIESIRPGGQDFSEKLTLSQFEDLNKDLFTKTIAAIDQAIRDASIITKDDIQDIVLSGGSSNIPFLQSAIKNYFGGEKNYYGSIHPETTSVSGAARLGAAKLGGSDGVCCTFMDELSLGIETAGGVMFKYTDQRSREFDKMFTFSTAMDNQDRVVIKVFEGERALTSHNAFLGDIELSGIPPAPKGVPQIRVRLSGPSCGNQLQLTVMDVATKKMNTTTISPRSAFMDEDEIISKILEGKAFEHEDRQIWENVEATGTWKLLNAP